MESATTVGKRGYAGLFLVTLATLMFEILLTRVFSVTMWYHLAFMAISIAMFGMTAGAIIIYLRPRRFTQQRAARDLAINAIWFALSMVLSFFAHLSIPFVADPSFTGFYSIVLTFALITVPFVFSGICVCIALTKFPRQVSRLYAADLAGAAVGCVLLIQLMRLTDGPTAVIVVAAVGALGGLLFAAEAGARRLMRVAAGICLIFLVLAGANTILAAKQKSMLRLIWVKGVFRHRPLYETWNSFSRVKVDGDIRARQAPFGWGMSAKLPDELRVRRLTLDIDAAAATVLTEFDGDPDSLEHLKYDVTNLAHYLRTNASVFVVGVGGGRDVLSALAFGQKSIVGVELNQAIYDALNDVYGEFTGHLDQLPNVRFITDEARSYIARTTGRFDIFQISLIDTWAATAAGAFVLAENSLYTVEAWQTFLAHLTPNGVLSVSRWYFAQRPGEVYRLATLARAALREMGVEQPRRHMMIVALSKRKTPGMPDGIGTLLLSRAPFSDADVATIERVAEDMAFEVLLNPRTYADANFEAITGTEAEYRKFLREFPLNIEPPTDDSPFFFNMLRLRDAFKKELWQQGLMSHNMKAVFTLAALLFVVFTLAGLCILVPLLMTSDKAGLRGSLLHFIFFASIGFGFMFIEISQMQRLIVFLGHPVYGLSIVLFAVLLSCGLGSYTTGRVTLDNIRRHGTRRLAALVVILVLFGLFTPPVIRGMAASSTPTRLVVAVLLLFPLGLFMGMPFPLALKLATSSNRQLTPWLWASTGRRPSAGPPWHWLSP